jgi:hypothetical protein
MRPISATMEFSRASRLASFSLFRSDSSAVFRVRISSSSLRTVSLMVAVRVSTSCSSRIFSAVSGSLMPTPPNVLPKNWKTPRRNGSGAPSGPIHNKAGMGVKGKIGQRVGLGRRYEGAAAGRTFLSLHAETQDSFASMSSPAAAGIRNDLNGQEGYSMHLGARLRTS